MQMLTQLGINSTVFIQFIIYIFIFTFLALFVFSPYAKAVEEREKKTKGSDELANEYHKKSMDLHSEYEVQAREVHSHIQEIFKQTKQEAQEEFEKIVSQARQAANQEAEKNRSSLQAALVAASVELKSQTTNISLAITNKVLGK